MTTLARALSLLTLLLVTQAVQADLYLEEIDKSEYSGTPNTDRDGTYSQGSLSVTVSDGWISWTDGLTAGRDIYDDLKAEHESDQETLSVKVSRKNKVGWRSVKITLNFENSGGLSHVDNEGDANDLLMASDDSSFEQIECDDECIDATNGLHGENVELVSLDEYNSIEIAAIAEKCDVSATLVKTKFTSVLVLSKYKRTWWDGPFDCMKKQD